MFRLPLLPALTSTLTIFSGQHGDVSRRARSRGVFRQTLYREAHAVVNALDPDRPAAAVAPLQQQLASLQAEVQQLRQRLQGTVLLDADPQAEFAATAQALGVSLSSTRALLTVLLGKAAPSVATLGRWTHKAGQQAHAALEVLDEHARQQARQVAADEILVGSRPVLRMVEQHSLCWLGGRRAESREGPEWAAEFGQLPHVEQVTRDGGQGLRNGLALVNAQRQQDGRPVVADQEDHFHLLHRLRRGLRGVRAKALAALRKAEQAQAQAQRDRRQGPLAGGRWALVAKCWRQAEQALDRWSAQAQALQRLRAGLRLFTPGGS